MHHAVTATKLLTRPHQVGNGGWPPASKRPAKQSCHSRRTGEKHAGGSYFNTNARPTPFPPLVSSVMIMLRGNK